MKKYTVEYTAKITITLTSTMEVGAHDPEHARVVAEDDADQIFTEVYQQGDTDNEILQIHVLTPESTANNQ